MTAAEFILSLSISEIARLTIMQLVIFGLSYQLVKSRQSSFIDPFTLALFFFASGWAIVFELLLMGMVSMRMLVIFLATNVAFLWGYLITAPKLNTHKARIARLGNFSLFGIFALFIYLGATLVNIWIYGLGIFHENRLVIYTESGGLGAIRRVADAYLPTSIFFLSYLIGNKAGLLKMGVVCLFFLITINTILDGSKSGLVAIFFAYVFSQRWLKDSKLIPPSKTVNKRLYLWILGSFIVALLVLGFQLNVHDDISRTSDLLTVLFFRLSIAGDIFILGFPNDMIDQLQNPHNPILVLFEDLLSTLRIWSSNLKPLGTQLINYVSSDLVNIAGGPNSHISIYSYYLFGGVGGAFLAFLFGILYGSIRMFYNNSIGNDPVLAALAITLLLNCANIPIDPPYTMFRITNVMLFLAPLVLLFFRAK